MKKLLLVVTLVSATFAWPSDQPQLVNAKVEQRSAAAGLEQQVRSMASQPGAAWIGYSEPVIAVEHTMCCFNSTENFTRNSNCCGGCFLEKRGNSFAGKVSDCQQLEPAKLFFVLMRLAEGQVQKVRVFSTNCALDGSGMTVYWLNDVKAAESIAYLTKLAESSPGTKKDKLGDGAIAAIALHNDPAADQSLAKLMTPDHNEHAVEQATFWAGTARGSRGYEIISAELARNENYSFRKHAVFALSQNSDPRSQAKLIDLARHDSNSEIRSESLFWLAQEAGKKVAGVITAAIEDDPNTDVKKKAVFALSEMPDNEGIPLLIEQAKRNANPVVRKEAMFWLGQKDDPRALQFITSILER